ncbi:MAG: glycosyltransferase family 2 protein [Bacteroidetes bacterium]|nr:glycosyltransferase family 2 protein [Bacteroidota bacterium]
MSRRISVIIPTVGRASLSQCLEGLARQALKPDDVQVVEDKARRGPGWARNEGIRKATGDILAFLDDDAVPPPDWLSSMVQAMDHAEADVAGGSFEETDPVLREIRALRPLPQQPMVDGLGLVGNSGNLLLRREVLDVLKARDGYWFTEEWGAFGSEDWELIMRVRSYGFHLVYVPVHVQHLRRVTPRQYWSHQFKRGVGIFLLNRAMRRRGSSAPQAGLLWDQSKPPLVRWLTVIAVKVFGPFTWSQFTRKRSFLIHWVAEKMQGAGYVWGVMRYGR